MTRLPSLRKSKSRGRRAAFSVPFFASFFISFFFVSFFTLFCFFFIFFHLFCFFPLLYYFPFVFNISFSVSFFLFLFHSFFPFFPFFPKRFFVHGDDQLLLRKGWREKSGIRTNILWSQKCTRNWMSGLFLYILTPSKNYLQVSSVYCMRLSSPSRCEKHLCCREIRGKSPPTSFFSLWRH